MRNLLKGMLCFGAGGLLWAQPVQAVDDTAMGAVTAGRQPEEIVPDSLQKWFERITVGGTIEFEASYAGHDYDDPAADDEDSSDLSLSKAELAVDAAILSNVSGHALLLYEDDEDIVMDEAYIMLNSAQEDAWHITAGKIYAPFGVFETALVSDPLTLEIGETRETVLELGGAFKGWYASLYAFNGDAERAGKDDHIDSAGLAAGYAYAGQAFSLDVSMGLINNVMNSGGLLDMQETMREEAQELNYTLDLKDRVPGLAAYAAISLGDFTLMGEYVGMLDDPEFVLSDVDASGALASLGLGEYLEIEALKAWGAELSYAFDARDRAATVAAGYQGVKNGGAFYPEKRVLAAVGMEILEDITCALEYRHDTFENDDTASQFTAKLALEF